MAGCGGSFDSPGYVTLPHRKRARVAVFFDLTGSEGGKGLSALCKMDVTIAICTRNRAASLRRTLNSLTLMEIPGGTQFELVVVDNGSTDNTASVIESFAGALPIRYDVEPALGVSHARNRALATARGKFIIWTDDDVLVNRQWLSAYVTAFARWPDVDLFGGKILPDFEDPVPDWLKSCLPVVATAFGMRDFGDRELEMRERDGLPYGANHALRTSWHRAVPFRVDLGLGTDLYGEETEVMRSVLAGGKTWRWIPAAQVQHFVPRERLTLAYIDSFFCRYGRTIAHLEGRNGPELLGAPRWLWRRLCSHALDYGMRRLTSGPESWMEARIWFDITRGKIDYYRRHPQLKTANGKSL